MYMPGLHVFRAQRNEQNESAESVFEISVIVLNGSQHLCFICMMTGSLLQTYIQKKK